MPSSPESARLSDAHRVAQTRLGAQVVTQLVALFRLVDPDRLDDTTADFVRIALPLIQRQRTVSASLSAGFIATFRALEIGDSGRVPVLAPAAPVEAVTTSLLVTGPAAVRSLLNRGALPAVAVREASARVGAAGMRHALDGGRETILEAVQSDPQAVGYYRTTSGRPCHFCAMLASRGAVYRSDSSGGFQAHDRCSCSAEPIFRDDSRMPASSVQYVAQWDQAKALARDEDLDPAVAFRRIVEGRTEPGTPGRKPAA